MITSSTATPAVPVAALLQDTPSRTRASAAPAAGGRGGQPREALPIAKTTFHGANPWAALHLAAENAVAEDTAPSKRVKPATKAKKPKKATA